MSSSQTTLKLKCDHFCCYDCFENILKKNECTNCKKKSLYPINQFKYYQLDSTDELISIKKWINANKFFPKLNFNLGYNLSNSNNNDWNNNWNNDQNSNDDYWTLICMVITVSHSGNHQKRRRNDHGYRNECCDNNG